MEFSQDTMVTSRILGLQWNSSTDCFRINPKDELIVTKRALLSEIAKVFDPLGWLTSITISLKIIFQKTWLTTVG